ncbi:YggS family pyridoxal phosphate-dependent enzyme [Falsarthrobacter nasiphocae]
MRDAAGGGPVPRLVVVTKNFPPSDALALAELGAADLGENRDQEAAPKAEALAGRLESPPAWHFIGQLQSNKAKSVVRYASAVHSADRLSLVKALGGAMSRALQEGLRPDWAGASLDVLVQVSLDDDAAGARGGAAPADVPRVAEAIASTPALELRGVMGVAPLGADPAPAFERLAAVRDALRADHPGAEWMSAGMSQDLEAAVGAGATHVRIGSDILGARR